jgi:hypothetical protein
MIISHYIGDHKKDTLYVRLGWAATRLVQFGQFQNITHCEAILKEFDDGSVLIGSSSVRDGGVRQKQVYLNPEHWILINVPSWDVSKSQAWFDAPENAHLPYSWGGAIRTGLPFLRGGRGVFCDQAVGAPHLVDSSMFTPAAFACITLSMPGSSDITKEFFDSRKLSKENISLV